MKKNNGILTIVLLAGIVLLVNILSNQFFFRLDLTQNRQYTLSRATRNILRELKDPVTVTAYFSADLPPEYSRIRRDFQDMLTEYGNLSKGKVNFQFIDPKTDEEKQKTLESGIQPLLINVSSKDQVKQQQAFMGAVLQQGEQQDVIPFLAPNLSMEYTLSSSIKKVSVVDKPAIGLVQGHGEPGLQNLGPALEALSVLYQVEALDLSADSSIAARFRAVVILAPQDSFPPEQLDRLDDYLSRGGKLCIALNRVEGDLNAGQGRERNTGLEAWLEAKGLSVPSRFVIDEQSGTVTLQQQQGFFTVASQVQLPYLPLITNFADHPITKGLEQVILPFASPVDFKGKAPLRFTVLMRSSARSGSEPAPVVFDVANREWTLADFPQRNLPLAGVLQGPIVGSAESTIVVFGDGDFPLATQIPDNVNLFVNSIDWLSDDTGLIDLRTKAIAARPIDSAVLGEGGEAQRSLLKYLNFGLPIVLVLLLGFFLAQRQRRLRLQRMQERYA